MMNNINRTLLSGLVLFMTAETGFAGNACEQTHIKPQLYLDAGKKALEVQNQLNHLNPRVALIARAGTNLKHYGQHYSHVGFVVKNYPGKKGKWTIVHLLNQCEVPKSSIYQQGLMNFFMDDLYTFDYQITIPKEAVQEKLYETLVSLQKQSLHNSSYSMITYPFSTKYQNSNQWVLEVIATSMNPQSAHTRQAAQAYLHKTHFKASLIKIDSFSKLGASLFSRHVRFDDHPLEEQRRNTVSTVTVSSVVDYLREQHYLKSNIAYQ